ncbi:hypothetical protein Mucpa_1961 [Mucilaginibacter paludis DSM 18603]|uniref:Uncharacterized protein n=1 Tax=Mucilaginibacter paludis DSM 18603 TaxID=714943 RepID=H1YD47_9SPHI|nr:hypothetical protein Mucpa_1961 [Mucilaginibacter paludis DSM 18603]
MIYEISFATDLSLFGCGLNSSAQGKYDAMTATRDPKDYAGMHSPLIVKRREK